MDRRHRDDAAPGIPGALLHGGARRAAAVHHRDAAQGQGALTEHTTGLPSAGGAVETAHRDAAAPIEVEQRRRGIAEGVDTIVGPCEYPRDPAGRADPRPRHVAHGLGDDEEAPSGLPQAWKQASAMSWNRYKLACIMAAPAMGSAPPARTSKARTSTPRRRARRGRGADRSPPRSPRASRAGRGWGIGRWSA